MNIAPIQNCNLKTAIAKRVKSSPSFGDMNFADEISIVPNSKRKPKEVRLMSPMWDFLHAQFIILMHKNSSIQDKGKKLMQEGWSMRFATKNLQDKAQELAINSKTEFQECIELLDDIKQHDYKSYRSNDYSSGWSKIEIERNYEGTIITEYDNDDEMEALRRLRISSDIITYQKVRYFSGLIDEYIFDKNSGQLLTLTVGKREFLSDGYKAEQVYNYDSNGELKSYLTNYKATSNSDSADEYFVFDFGIIKKYYKDYYAGGHKSQTCASKILTFTKEGCTQADINYKDILDDKKTVSKQYLFDTHGNIDTCLIDLKEEQNGLITSPEVFMYKKGILDEVATKYKSYKNNNVVTADKLFRFKLAGQHGGSCYLKNMGILGDNYQIDDCKSEKVAIFYK